MNAWLLRYPRTVAAGANLSLKLTGRGSATHGGVLTESGTSAAQPGYSGSISIQGTNWVNGVGGAGSIIVPKGVNLSGLEDSCAQGNAPWYGVLPDYNTLKTWGANFVRIPLNAASFLGLNCCQINGGGNGWVSTTAASVNYGGAYIAAVDAAIKAAQAIGCYVILDLHWSAPQFTFGGVTRYATPLWQPPFMNANTDLAFWSAIATRYGSQAAAQPGINNNGIIFELFNEPYMDQMSGYSQNGALLGIMKSGGTVTEFYTNYATSTVAQSWTALGYQQALNQIRANGAANPVITNGCGYSNASAEFASFMPIDTLSPPQVAIGQHTYPAGSYPNNTYPNVYPDSGAGSTAWSAGALAVIAAGIPWIVTEDGDEYGPAASSGSPHCTYMTGFCAARSSGYIAWTFCPTVESAGAGASGTFYLLTNGQPTQGEGAVVYQYLSGSTQSSTVTVPNVVSLTAAAAAAVLSSAGLSESVSSANSATVAAGSIISQSPAAGTSVASGSTVTVVSSLGAASGTTGAPTLVQMLLQGQTSQNQASYPGGSNGYQPQSPNYTMIGWLSVNGATSYNIYRATIPVGSQNTSPSYSAYASISASAAASAYSGYVSGSGGAPYQNAVNCAYGDTVATNCVNGVQGGPEYWAATGYSYKVTAVVGGTESAQSAPHVGVYVSNGVKVLYITSFNYDPVANSTAGGTNPNTGNSQTVLWNSGSSPYWNPYVGNGGTTWNLNVRAFNYFQFWIKADQNDSGSLATASEQEGDNLINTPTNGTNGTPFASYSTPSGNLQSGVWTLVKIPLSVLMTDVTRGRQNTHYKFGSFGVNGMSGTWHMDALEFVT